MSLTVEEIRSTVRRIYRDHGHSDDWGVPVLYEEAMARHLASALTDRETLDEDVTGHCMWGPFAHDDGRQCYFHARLDAWTFDNAAKCLRPGHPDPFGGAQ